MELLTTKPLLNKQETNKGVKKDLAISGRYMHQKLANLVNKLTKTQYNNLSALIISKEALNTNKNRQHANEQIYLNILIRNITEKNIL